MGFPLISVTQRVDGDKRILKLSQTRFIADGSKDDQNLLWQVISHLLLLTLLISVIVTEILQHNSYSFVEQLTCRHLFENIKGVLIH